MNERHILEAELAQNWKFVLVCAHQGRLARNKSDIFAVTDVREKKYGFGRSLNKKFHSVEGKPAPYECMRSEQCPHICFPAKRETNEPQHSEEVSYSSKKSSFDQSAKRLIYFYGMTGSEMENTKFL